MTYLETLSQAILKTHGVKATHLHTEPVTETFQGKVIWQGEVEVFQITHPLASRCFAWGYPSDKNQKETECVAVLQTGPIQTPLDAVRAAIRFSLTNNTCL